MDPKEKFDYGKVEALGRQLLIALGEDPDRAGLVDTPRRFARAWEEFILYDPGNCDTTFEVETTDEMVAVKGIRVWSFCEHHLLPFWADVSIGYIAMDKILGLSKFGRIAHEAAHRLQLQERLTKDIADEVIKLTGSQSVAVIAEGEHLCMTMRGIKTPSRMISSVMRGVFRDKPEARAEFLAMIHR